MNFSDTEIAFHSKSQGALRRSYWLFRAVNHPWLVKVGTSLGKMALSAHLPVQGIIKATLFRQFCGGETIEECGATIRELAKYHIGTILDYSVEGLDNETSFDETLAETLRGVEFAGKNKNLPFAVFKMTGIARFALMEKVSAKQSLDKTEKTEWQRGLSRLEAICRRCHELDVRVFVDAEESWIQDAIDAAVESMMEKYNRQKAIVYNTVQLYRHDRLTYISQSHARAKKGKYFQGLKLVRGAYMEKERARAEAKGQLSPIYDDKAGTDHAYDEALNFCMNNVERISFCAGTHNENSSLLLTQLMRVHEIAKSDERVYFAQLLGMSDHISYNLANDGYKVAKYVPYGPVKAVFPYLVRRAQENTSIQGQSGRELTLIEYEWRRRQGALPN